MVALNMKKHFVTFLSPGTFSHEETSKEIDSWDVEKAKQMARGIKERHNATPFAFYFTTRSRNSEDLDSKVSATSPTYYLGGKVETFAEVEARATKDDSILLSNMRCNNWDRIITNTNSWRVTQPLHKEDVVLDWESSKAATAGD
jgi:hypothetical protein